MTSKVTYKTGGGRMVQWIDSIFALHPAAPVSIPSVPMNFSEFLMLPRLIDGAAALSSGQQRLYNIDQSHLVLWLVAGITKKRIAFP